MNPSATKSSPPTGMRPFPWPGPDFDRNRAAVSLDDLKTWAGRHVAWSWDGSRIIAGGDTLAALCDELGRLGVDPGVVVFDYIDLPDAVAG
jgi:hypothetical protein